MITVIFVYSAENLETEAVEVEALPRSISNRFNGEVYRCYMAGSVTPALPAEPEE